MAGITYQIFNNSNKEELRVFCRLEGEEIRREVRRTEKSSPDNPDLIVEAFDHKKVHIWAAVSVDDPPQNCCIDFFPINSESKSQEETQEAPEFCVAFEPGTKEFILSWEPGCQSDIKIDVSVRDR